MQNKTITQPGRVWRVLLVDDHPLLRQGLTEVLHRHPDLFVCGEAEDRVHALKLIPEVKPDLVIADLALKNSSGLDLIKDIRDRHSGMRILVVSMQEELVYAERVLRAGASGYITKQEAATRIVEAVRKVLEGGTYLSERVTAQIAARLVGRPPVSTTPVELLADRELEVFKLIAQGLSVRQISERLHLDKSTVETYRARIREKLGLKDALELLQYAIQWEREGKRPE